MNLHVIALMDPVDDLHRERVLLAGILAGTDALRAQ
jgi:hypothetical protein